MPLTLPSTYPSILATLKDRIQRERLRIVLAANSALIQLYWDIGLIILQKQEQEGWGTKVIDRLSADLGKAFPDMSGLSTRNLKYMRAFAAAWPEEEIVQQAVAQLPWVTTSPFSTSSRMQKPGFENLRGSLPSVEELEAELGEKNEGE